MPEGFRNEEKGDSAQWLGVIDPPAVDDMGVAKAREHGYGSISHQRTRVSLTIAVHAPEDQSEADYRGASALRRRSIDDPRQPGHIGNSGRSVFPVSLSPPRASCGARVHDQSGGAPRTFNIDARRRNRLR